MKQSLKPCTYNQSKRFFGDVTAYLLFNGPASYACAARLSATGAKPERKRVLIGREMKLHVVDAKPGDLAMTRMKSQ